MNPDRRRELEDRRRALQRKVELDERRELLTFQLRDLDQLGIPYEVEYETEPLVDWTFGRFPTTMRGISWSEVGDHLCEPGDNGVLLLAAELLASGAAQDDDDVEVLFSNGRSPALRLRFADVLAHGTVLAADFESWLLCRKRGWIMEYISTRGWCCGFSASIESEDV